MSSKRFHQPPQAVGKDIDPESVANAKELDKMISVCINLASTQIEKDLKNNFPKNSNYRFQSILKKSLETHEVIRHIFRSFGKENKPHQLCAMPLARQQIEFVFYLAFFLRNPEKFSDYERDTLTKIYKRFVYEAEETKNLPRFQQGTKQRQNLIISWMLGKGPIKIQCPFTKNELKTIEEFVKKGENLKNGLGLYLSPKDIVNKLSEKPENQQIVDVLFRLYVEYEWLSAYVHPSDWSSMVRDVILSQHPRINLEDFYQKEARTPVINRSYLSMLISATDISKFLKNPIELRVQLSKAWELFEAVDFLYGFVWQRWAKDILGILNN